MRMSENIKTVSYLKSHTAEIIREFDENEKTYIITQNDEAKAVLQDIKSYEELQKSLTLLKILALSSENLSKGKHKPVNVAFPDVKKKIKGE